MRSPRVKLHSAGENQDHILENAFNVLSNDGFLRDQGILTLESVQEFYKTIKHELKRATLITSNLLETCYEDGSHELSPRPVIILTTTQYGIVSGHSVVVKSYDRSEDCLELTTVDSLSETGETLVECSIFVGEGGKVLAIGEFPDQWCLASPKCYYFQLN